MNHLKFHEVKLKFLLFTMTSLTTNSGAKLRFELELTVAHCEYTISLLIKNALLNKDHQDGSKICVALKQKNRRRCDD